MGGRTKKMRTTNKTFVKLTESSSLGVPNLGLSKWSFLLCNVEGGMNHVRIAGQAIMLPRHLRIAIVSSGDVQIKFHISIAWPDQIQRKTIPPNQPGQLLVHGPFHTKQPTQWNQRKQLYTHIKAKVRLDREFQTQTLT